MPLHGKITPEQWMAIAGALQNVGGMFGRPGQQGQGNQLMMQAMKQQSSRRKEQEFRDLLKGFATPTVRGPQYAGPPPAGPTNLVPPSAGGRVPVGSQLPGLPLQTQPGTASQVQPSQSRITPQMMSLIGALGPKQGMPFLLEQLTKGPRERFDTVKNPYGLGGVGQRSSTTGQISGYQKAAARFGPMEYDEKLKRHYQKGPKGRRHYVKAGEGALTAAQLANNREIDQARARVQQLGEDLPPGVTLSEELHRRMSTRDLRTGGLVPDFNSFWGKIGWLSMQNKPGGDPDHARWSRILMMPPQFSDPAGPKSLPPGVTAEEPSVLDHVRGYLFGNGGASAPAPDGSGNAPRRGRYPRPGAPGQASQRPLSMAIPQMSITEIDDLIKARGNSLLPAELEAIQARLATLGAG